MITGIHASRLEQLRKNAYIGIPFDMRIILVTYRSQILLRTNFSLGGQVMVQKNVRELGYMGEHALTTQNFSILQEFPILLVYHRIGRYFPSTLAPVV